MKPAFGVLALLIGASAIATADVHPIVGGWEVVVVREYVSGPEGDPIPIDTVLADEGFRLQLVFSSTGRFQTRTKEERNPWDYSDKAHYTIDREAQTATVVHSTYYQGGGKQYVRTSFTIFEYEFSLGGGAVLSSVFVDADGERDPYPTILFVEPSAW